MHWQGMNRRRKSSNLPKIDTLTAKGLGSRGDAIFDGPVYANGILPGEIAKLDIRGQRATVLKRLSSHPHRVTPLCSIADQCGGCSVQHYKHEAYQHWKRNLVADALDKAGIKIDLPDLIDAHGEGRRRITFHAARFRGKLVFGFNERARKSIIPLDHCPAAVEEINAAINGLKTVADAILKGKAQANFHVLASETGLDVAIKGAVKLGLAEHEVLADCAMRFGWARLTVNDELIVAIKDPEIYFGSVKLVPPPAGFLQATKMGEHILADRVMAASKIAKPINHVVDLFSGAGAFGLRLAHQAAVLAVETEAKALRALKSACERTARLKPVEGLRRDLFHEPLTRKELASADLVVIDPPRAGASAQMAELAQSSVPVICSISCNPISFARDARILLDGGYELVDITLIDQFKWTSHLEIAAILTKSN